MAKHNLSKQNITENNLEQDGKTSLDKTLYNGKQY